MPLVHYHLEQIWESHRDDVRRALLALTRDVELTEDCLQDTYLRAHAGIANYRDGNARAWLITIAKNVFYTHARRKSYGSELHLDSALEQAEGHDRVDTDSYLALLAIRDAMSTLDPKLRGALIMKHYGGCDYGEIGAYLTCSPAMAKHRVWRAMQKLRSTLGLGEESSIECAELSGPKILDWLYNALSQRESDEIGTHITLCPACKKNLLEIRRLSAVLDKADGDYRILTLIDLDEHGRTTRYVWVKHVNTKHDIMTTWRWWLPLGWSLEYLALQGEQVEPQWPGLQKESQFMAMDGELPNPVPRGELIDAMFITCPPAGNGCDAEQVSKSIWQYHHGHSPFPSRQGLFVVTIRLPQGAKLLSADPEPQKTSTRTGRISLNWRIITEPVPATPGTGPKWQFESLVKYKLKV